MNKKRHFLNGIGFLLIVFPFFINSYSLVRLLILFMGILTFGSGIFLKQRKKNFKVIFFLFFLLLFLYGIDSISVCFFHRFPIFAVRLTGDSNFSTFDSLLYRVYNCNGKKTFDSFYRLNYVCDYTLEKKEINSFLSSRDNNYQKYRSKFVTIQGKVSEVFGNEYLALQMYEQKENGLVGQIIFNKNSSLKVINNHGNLKFYNYYEIYDNVLVTGRIVKKENNEIIMYDAKIEVVNNFDDFTIQVIEDKTCKNKIKKLASVDEFNYYSNCLDEIFVKYDEETIYDIILALETKKLSFAQWITEGKKEDKKEYELYKFSNYNLLKCKDSNTIIIENNKLKSNQQICANFQKDFGNNEIE